MLTCGVFSQYCIHSDLHACGSRSVYRLRPCGNKSSIEQSVAVLDVSLRHSVPADCQQRTFYLWWHAAWSNTHHFEQGGESLLLLFICKCDDSSNFGQSCLNIVRTISQTGIMIASFQASTHPPSFLSVTKLIYFFHRKLRHQKYC